MRRFINSLGIISIIYMTVVMMVFVAPGTPITEWLAPYLVSVLAVGAAVYTMMTVDGIDKQGEDEESMEDYLIRKLHQQIVSNK